MIESARRCGIGRGHGHTECWNGRRVLYGNQWHRIRSCLVLPDFRSRLNVEQLFETRMLLAALPAKNIGLLRVRGVVGEKVPKLHDQKNSIPINHTGKAGISDIPPRAVPAPHR